MSAQASDRDRKNPTIAEAFLSDTQRPFDTELQRKVLRDLKRPSRRFFFPIFRWVAPVLTMLVSGIKYFFPNLQSVKLLNSVGVWFSRNMIAPEALEYLLLHFHHEAHVINFIARNSGDHSVQTVDLFPLSANELGDHKGTNAIVQHDINVYNLIIDLGLADAVDLDKGGSVDLEKLNFNYLSLENINIDPDRKRLINLDIDTCCYIVPLFLAICLSRADFERAVVSLQFDFSLMSTLSKLTSDPVFRHWAPVKFTNWFSQYNDAGKMLRWHMFVMEYAYEHLLKLSEKKAQ